MLTLSGTLTAHQKLSARKPSLRVIATNTRRGNHLLRWQRWYTGAEADSPHAACVAPDGSLVRVRNDAGTLFAQRVAAPTSGSTFSAWTNIMAGLVVGSGVAVTARNAASGELLMSYTRGTSLYVRTSADNGATWSAELLLFNEGAAIGFIAAAYRASNGDACVFYTAGAVLKRARRTAGTWAASGTAATPTFAGLTGVAAVHTGGDFNLLVSGTAVTTAHKRVWAVVMGDGTLPVNTWSALVDVAESDAASTTTFAGPSLARFVNGTHEGAFSWKEAGSVVFNRAFQCRPPAGNAFTGFWTEPQPHEMATAFGIALAHTSTGSTTSVYATTPSAVFAATIGQALDLSGRLLSASVAFTPYAADFEIVLDNADGTLLYTAPGAPAIGSALLVGGELSLEAGYLSGAAGAAEYGSIFRATIRRLRHEVRAGQRTVVVTASGPWEAAAAWQAPRRGKVRRAPSPAGSSSRGSRPALASPRSRVPARPPPPATSRPTRPRSSSRRANAARPPSAASSSP